MKKSFLEYFRCPAALVDFRLSADLCPTPGFFSFGPDLVCYGRIAAGRTQREPSGALEDAHTRMRVDRSTTYLPFDLDEIVENLRYERYRVLAHTAVRPLLPTSVRKHLQRVALHGWDQTPFPKWPIDVTVDRLFESMMQAVISANSGERVPFIWFWPEGFSSCAVVTHDVETEAGRDFCQTLMDLDESHDIKSSFQLIPEGRYEVTEGFLRSLRERAFEVNVHDFNHDGELFQNRDEFLRRVARINAYGKRFQALGYRSGVLYRNLDWYDAFEYSYDMSVPNVGHLDPQPGGCCTVKPFFIGNILEIPVVATQDYTLFHILRQYSIELWDRQIDLILKHNGLISFIVHPDYLLEKKARGVYLALLEHLSRSRRDANMWITLPRELNQWWRDRNEMRLVKDGVDWRVEGPNKNRARVAYASVEGDRVVYSLEDKTTAAVPVDIHLPNLHSGHPA
jgi:hypothetical protein